MQRATGRPDPEKNAGILAELHRDVAARQAGYRARALRIFPHICARCGREFSGRRLSELTVHHKDSNAGNNPPDGSNWELLCMYCHDDQHGIGGRAKASGGDAMPVGGFGPSAIASPFDKLDAVLGGDKPAGKP